MRPNAIVTFERLALFSLLVLAAQLAIAPAQSAAFLSAGAVTIVSGIGLAIEAGLVLLASRRRSGIARWLVTLIFAWGVVTLLYDLVSGVPFDLLTLTDVAATALQLGALAMLFSGGARRWFSGDEVVVAK